MSKILLIIQREYLVRIRKRSFVVMALLGPFLFALGMIVPLWLGTSEREVKVIEIIDESGYFQNKLPETPDITFVYMNESPDQRMVDFLSSDHYALFYIPEIDLSNPRGVILYSKTQPSPGLKFYLEKILNQAIYLEKVRVSGIDENVFKDLETNISIVSKSVFEDWQDENEGAAAVVIALFSSILSMFFIVLYGGQVMRGVIEEKTNRIIEVIISSVRPFELMMGKILGIALLSLTQFAIWIALTIGITFFINSRYESVFEMYSNEHIETTLKSHPQLNAKEATEINSLMNAIQSVDFTYTLVVFLFYFLSGYLLYSTLFATIGSAVDVETDTQQFVFPLIAPLMFCVLMATSIVQNPHSPLAFWLSVIPFTSPVAMMLRLPFGVPIEELLASMVILLASFVLFTWIAGRAYRIGVLMYGKKVTLPEIIRWVFYKS